MSDWRQDAQLTRFPEDNDVIGVPINASVRLLSQEEADFYRIVRIELEESDKVQAIKRSGSFAIACAITRPVNLN